MSQEKTFQKNICVGLLAHVDAGKTTLSEALLYRSGTLRKFGRVDHRDTFLDHFDQERKRGITIFSKQALFTYGNTSVTLLDTPGHADFSSEMERCLQIMDYAVLVISGTDGVQAHTDTLWTLLNAYRIPTFIFVTKMDVSVRSREELMEGLRKDLSDGCIDFSDFSPELPDETVSESIAMLDEGVLENYLETGTVGTDAPAELIRKRKLFPCFFGSGLKLEGIEHFLDALDRYTVSGNMHAPGSLSDYGDTGVQSSGLSSDAFGAKVYKIMRDSKGKRLTCLRVTGGALSVRDLLNGEKVSELRLYSGLRYDTADTVTAGQVCAIPGLTGTYPGQGLGFEPDSAGSVLEPVLGYRILPPKGMDAGTLLPKLKQLEEEDPQLHIVWQERLGEIRIQLMGAVQTDVIRELIRDRFDVEVQIDSGRILYRETIAEPVEGVGHYEPLKHYAEVHLLLEPLPRGSGLLFDSSVSTDDLDLNWQRLILTHLTEKQHSGVLTGSPITDIKITLAAGRAHLKHTEGGDFRQATYRAVRNGLMKARSVLLEPVFDFRLEVPTENIGRAITDIRNMGGEQTSPEPGDAGRSVITGTAPAAAMSGYLTEVLAYTGGKGRFSCHPAGYRECSEAVAASVVQEAAYDPEADPENSPDSVFCAHGAGFNVKWNQVEEYMHLESVLRPVPPESGNGAPALASAYSPNFQGRSSGSAISIDEKEVERIMEREFGPIRRKSYSSPSVNGTPVPAQKTEQRRERLIVDGYNLLFAGEELKKLATDNIDLARENLINKLVNYCGYKNTETVLVFDAYKVPGNKGEKYDESGLHIAYTRENESADLYIERLADEIGKNEHVRVVTSDSLIRLTALRSGVLRTSSAEFWNELEDTLRAMREELGRQ